MHQFKPKHGLTDGYAPNLAGFKDDRFMEQLKALQPGDSVTIRFSTDFERHRIETLRKNDNVRPEREGNRSAKKTN